MATTKSSPGEQETGEHSPLPWSIRDRDNLEFGKSITIDTGGPQTPSRWGGVASVLNAVRLMSSTTLQEDRHREAIANAELIVKTVNSHAQLERERDALREAAMKALVWFETDYDRDNEPTMATELRAALGETK
jgi:hypothetical protein